MRRRMIHTLQNRCLLLPLIAVIGIATILDMQPQMEPVKLAPTIRLKSIDVVQHDQTGYASPSGSGTTAVPTSALSISPTSSQHVTAEGHGPILCQDLDIEPQPVANGTVASWRGILVLLVTCGAQLLDQVFFTAVNITLPAIQRDFNVDNGPLQWAISAYTLTFGGLLLLAGVMSDRYGRKHVFCAGLIWMSVWTLAIGFASSFIQLAIFRALQGVGAAMNVPSSIGIISAYFVARDRTRALMYFGAAGGVGFCVGLILGGFITSALGWRYLFYLTVIVTGSLAVMACIVLPQDRPKPDKLRPRLDLLGAAISTSALIMLSFVLSGGGQYGWSKAFIITLLVVSVALLLLFAWVEQKVQNPIMPLAIWKEPNFAAIWVTGFVAYGAYAVELYYLILITQKVIGLSPGQTAVRLLPMGFVGGSTALSMGKILHRFDSRPLLLIAFLACTIAPIPTATMHANDLNFWKHIFPTSMIGVAGIASGYCTITVVLLASVPVSAKSLCGGMINTAYQLGSGVGLALATAVVQAAETNKGHGLLAQYTMGMWFCVGFAGIGLVIAVFGIRRVKTAQVLDGGGDVQ